MDKRVKKLEVVVMGKCLGLMRGEGYLWERLGGVGNSRGSLLAGGLVSMDQIIIRVRSDTIFLSKSLRH